MDEEPREGSPQGTDSEGSWQSYRCPVCGHMDAVTETDEGPVTLPCSHCETILEVHVSPHGAERTTVHVRREDAEE